MKPTKEVYDAMNDDEGILCDDCKFCNCRWEVEPCKSCVVSNFQQLNANEKSRSKTE